MYEKLTFFRVSPPPCLPYSSPQASHTLGQRLSDAAFAGDLEKLAALLADPTVNVDSPDNVSEESPLAEAYP